MKALCVGRHEFLSNHLGQFFGELGVETECVVGLQNAVSAANSFEPDVVVCDYDLLATLSIEAWEEDPLLSNTPVLAVSLTRRPDEVHVLNVNSIAGFLYLPTLSRDAALKILQAAADRPKFSFGQKPPSVLWKEESGSQSKI